MRTQEWKKEQIQILKEIQEEKPNATFWAEGYCPQEGEPDEDTNENGQYYTGWDNLTAEELIDKLEDDRYDIKDWDEEALGQELNRCDFTWRVEPCEQTDFENSIRCVETDNLKENDNNRWYCPMHQQMVNEINKKRIYEANQKLIENINSFIDEELKAPFQNKDMQVGYRNALWTIRDKLNDGYFSN